MLKALASITTATILILYVTGASHAADSEAKQPLDQAIESVDKNLAKDPDNKGLQNAAERLQTNQQRQQKKRAAQEEKRRLKKERHAEKHQDREKAGHPEEIEHPDKPERPEKPERPMGRQSR